MAWCWSSRHRFIASAAAVPFLQFTHDLAGDLSRPAADIDRDRMLIRSRFLQGRELAVEQRDRHEVPVPCNHAAADEVIRSFEVDQRHSRTVTDNDVPI